jgi:hypothetical protein
VGRLVQLTRREQLVEIADLLDDRRRRDVADRLVEDDHGDVVRIVLPVGDMTGTVP